MKPLSEKLLGSICHAPDDLAAGSDVSASASASDSSTGATSQTDISEQSDPQPENKAPRSLVSAASEETDEASEVPENVSEEAEDKAGEDQDGNETPEEANPLDLVPENGTYDFTGLDLPEGFDLDTKLAEMASPIMAEAGMTQRQANKMADVVVAMQKKEMADWQAKQEAWQKQARSDDEIGNQNFEESIKQAGHVLKTYGTPEFEDFLDRFGMGNHPEMIRFMARVGKATTEDDPSGSASSGATSKDRASILYPND